MKNMKNKRDKTQGKIYVVTPGWRTPHPGKVFGLAGFLDRGCLRRAGWLLPVIFVDVTNSIGMTYTLILAHSVS